MAIVEKHVNNVNLNSVNENSKMISEQNTTVTLGSGISDSNDLYSGQNGICEMVSDHDGPNCENNVNCENTNMIAGYKSPITSENYYIGNVDSYSDQLEPRENSKMIAGYDAPISQCEDTYSDQTDLQKSEMIAGYGVPISKSSDRYSDQGSNTKPKMISGYVTPFSRHDREQNNVVTCSVQVNDTGNSKMSSENNVHIVNETLKNAENVLQHNGPTIEVQSGNNFEKMNLGYNETTADVSVQTQQLHENSEQIEIVEVLSTKCWYTSGMVENVKSEFLVDTGSTFTIVDIDLFNSIPEKVRPKLEHIDLKLRSANGALMNVFGESKLKLKIGNQYFVHPCKIVGIGDKSSIIGLDFMQSEKCVLWLEKGTMQVGSRSIRIPLYRMADKMGGCAKIQLAEKLCIKPRQEVIIQGKLHHKNNQFTGNCGLIEPNGNWDETKGIFVAKTLVSHDPVSNKVPIRIMNVTNKIVEIEAGHSIAKICSIDPENITIFSEKSMDDGSEILYHIEQTENCEVPEHLKCLIENLAHDITPKQKKEIEHIVCNYTDCFVGPDGKLGLTDLVNHEIDTGNAPPIKIRYREPPLHLRKKVDDELDRMEKQGIIEDSDSPWSFPMVIVAKKGGEQIRICQDYRKLNDITVKSAQNLPKISECLDSLSGAQYFCSMDLANGYWQCKLKESDRCKTSFATRNGLKQFTVLAMGLCNASQTFTKMMEKLLHGLHWKHVLLYLDDVICFGSNFSDMKVTLCQVLDRFKQHSLKLKPSKCRLFQEQTEFLGYIISRDGVHCDPKKTECIRQWDKPKCPKDIRSFLGFCQYHRKFVQGFSEIARPLYNLTKKNQKWDWNEDCENSFQTLKSKLIQSPVLAYPNEQDLFVLDTDASQFSAGATLSQIQNGEERVIAYGSKLFSKSASNLCTTNRELLAVVMFVTEYSHYLKYNKFFILRTDHASLQWISNFKSPDGLLFRWLQILSGFSYRVVHRAGTKHINADSLSRLRPKRKCRREDCPDCYLEPELCSCNIISENICDNDDKSCMEDNSLENCLIITRSQAKKFDTPMRVGNDSENTTDGDNEPDSNSDSICNWAETLSHDDIKQKQEEDPVISEILKLKNQGDTQPNKNMLKSADIEFVLLWLKWKKLEIHKGILYRRYTAGNENSDFLQIVAPKSIRDVIMKLLHNHKTAGHFGNRKTVQSCLMHKFYWPNYKDDIIKWIQSCKTCQKVNTKCNPKKAPLHSKPVFRRMERVAIDIMKVPVSEEGYNSIQVVSDCFTKYSEFYALKDNLAQTCADVIVTQWITRFGCPLVLHSDGAKNYQSELFANLCKLLDIHQTKTARYRPQSNSVVERNNRTLKKLLQSVVGENPKTWPDFLPFVQQAFNSSVHSSTGFTPNRLMFGSENRQVVDLIFAEASMDDPIPPCPSEYVEWVKAAAREAYSKAREHLKQKTERNKTYYDKNSFVRSFNMGDWVWVFSPAELDNKLAVGWKGPFLVIQKLGPVNYVVQKEENSRKITLHIDHMKKYAFDDTPKTWVHPVIKPDKFTQTD